jgi:hypothetical protein
MTSRDIEMVASGSPQCAHRGREKETSAKYCKVAGRYDLIQFAPSTLFLLQVDWDSCDIAPYRAIPRLSAPPQPPNDCASTHGLLRGEAAERPRGCPPDEKLSVCLGTETFRWRYVAISIQVSDPSSSDDCHHLFARHRQPILVRPDR